ncbi:MAG: glycosyltransferase, partial [Chloroflexi bacterium]|nr:glycosyltransferase [Chloroflexota bacterium]
TLHDMWALTGHCSYSYECERWQTGCGKCPRLDEPVALRRDTTAFHWRLKNRTYGNSHLRIVTPCQWLADIVRKSPLLGRFQVHHIPYGLDTEVYRPLERGMARDILGLPQDAPLILFAADSVADARKGARYFEQAIAILAAQRTDLAVAIMGQNSDQMNIPKSVKTWNLGVISDDRLIAAAYAAVDIFACPTMADTGPQTVLESMACGTPVVAFDDSGIEERVTHMEDGYLARYQDEKDLAHGLSTLLDDSTLRKRMGDRARGTMVQRFSLEQEAKGYLDVYQELVEEVGRVEAQARPLPYQVPTIS